MSPTVVGIDEQAVVDVDVNRWAALATATLLDEGVASGELNLLFVDAAAMTEFNRIHMDEDRPTDVLAFPLDEVDDGAGDGWAAPVLGDDGRLLGDVVVCPEVAAAQASERGIETEAEIALLVVHGVLHVLGHDHAAEAERAAMQAREQAALAAHFRS